MSFTFRCVEIYLQLVLKIRDNNINIHNIVIAIVIIAIVAIVAIVAIIAIIIYMHTHVILYTYMLNICISKIIYITYINYYAFLYNIFLQIA